MKIYTRTGDTGTTGLFGGDRVAKHHPRIDTYGTVDETNSFIGAARAFMRGMASVASLDDLLARVQRTLFVLGGDLATPLDSRAKTPRIEQEDIDYLEIAIDALETDLAPLRHFILPGGSPAGAQLHVARTVCRRAERLATHLAHEDAINQQAVVYLNRLSDFLFVAARWLNSRAGVAEDIWHGDR